MRKLEAITNSYITAISAWEKGHEWQLTLGLLKTMRKMTATANSCITTKMRQSGLVTRQLGATRDRSHLASAEKKTMLA